MTRILLFLFAFLAAAPACAAVELSFYSHELTGVTPSEIDFPHAFITMRGTPDAGGKSIDGNWGFTAAKVSPTILMGPVKGVIESAPRAYVRASRRHLTLHLTDARFAAVQAAYRRWASVRGKSYDLETRNCIHFVGEMAKAAGLGVPNDASLMKSPRAYLDALVARNREVARR
jgi:hypothetical protein